jgi:hypothetical protein
VESNSFRGQIEELVSPWGGRILGPWRVLGWWNVIWYWGREDTGFAAGDTPEQIAARIEAQVFGGL